MKKLLLILCAFPLISQAGVSGIESDAKSIANGKKSFDGNGTLGYNVGIEFPMLRNFLSFNMNFTYARMEIAVLRSRDESQD